VGRGAGARLEMACMHRSVAAVVALTVLALSLPFSLAIAASAFAQEPEPPTGEPQPGEPPEEPAPTPEEPAPEPPTGEQPGVETGGELPRTGWDALLYLALGVMLVLGGARLRVVTRIREAVQRVRHRSTETALREALEPIRAARLRPPEPDPDPGPLHVEPSTPTARRRMAGVGQPDDRGH
jgi:hypothetical protein